ncbi:putative hydrolase YcgS [Tenuibacillus multivorans]|uniref:Pimeloyl-ACP methyl ester carboxylesterase n=2 Tax=Tenuibacillus multivorans TaxID=237069 RepID=A0A1H0DS17_9BACI|nr:alpha/beta hydrolase [Tenuibacillus multivorans]GEL78826.1 putative hydrolase YcgS [Tenuibacillus multivorans]SDN73037.1 Pimeloyl-ACP methyl ester carboxylesterase [Tenuibacillus multivorans]
MKRNTYTITYENQPIEYSVIGEGEPIMILHGGHSNSTEEFGYQPLIQNGYQIITPSRPGYGQTSKHWDNLDKASDVYRAIVNHLALEKIHIIAVSAGGPSGIHIASTYPEYVQSLTLQSAVTKEWLTPKNLLFYMAKIMFNPMMEKFTWAMTRTMNNRFPNFMFKQMAPSFTTLKGKDLQERISTTDIDEMKKMNSRYNSGHGFLIDIQLPNQLKKEHLQNIKAPTLIVHSINDDSVSLDHPKHASEHIPNSELIEVDTWGHLIWIGKGSEEVHERQIDFLRKYSLAKV